MMKLYMLCVFGILLFWSMQSVRVSAGIPSIQNNSDTLKIYLSEWNKDSLGCLGLRTIDKSKYIGDKLGFEGRTATEMLEMMGKPNSTSKSDDALSYEYLIGVICDNKGMPMDSTDFCWVNFFMKDSMVQEVSYTCL